MSVNSIIITCNNCGTRNRIPAEKQHLGPKCGNCKTALSLREAAVPVELDDSSFDSFINQATKPVMVDFFSPTCGPCRMLAPIIDTLAKKFYGRVIIAKLDRIPLQDTGGPDSAIFQKRRSCRPGNRCTS
jgi:hypothetical protein